jgi:hypothetical protein
MDRYTKNLLRLHYMSTSLQLILCMAICFSCSQSKISPPSVSVSQNPSDISAQSNKNDSSTTPHKKSLTKSNLVTHSSQVKLKSLLQSNLNQLPILHAMKGIKRWEPSGAAVIGETLWIISDRGARLARYTLPLQKGKNKVLDAWKLKPDLDHRIKWEGLEADTQGRLWLLEAISRSVWLCDQPRLGCPKLKRVDLGMMNQKMDPIVPKDFKYIMFEAIAIDAQGPLVGVRGFNDKQKGLTPWSLLVRPNSNLLMSQSQGLLWQGKSYGLSGAHFDHTAKGFWITWSYEDESKNTKNSVAGLLSFLPLSKKVSLPQSSSKNNQKITPSLQANLPNFPEDLKLCMQFPLKPEGVTRWKDQIIIVFDEDKDRKGGKNHQGDQFALKRSQDYAWSDQVPKCFPYKIFSH